MIIGRWVYYHWCNETWSYGPATVFYWHKRYIHIVQYTTNNSSHVILINQCPWYHLWPQKCGTYLCIKPHLLVDCEIICSCNHTLYFVVGIHCICHTGTHISIWWYNVWSWFYFVVILSMITALCTSFRLHLPALFPL